MCLPLVWIFNASELFKKHQFAEKLVSARIDQELDFIGALTRLRSGA